MHSDFHPAFNYGRHNRTAPAAPSLLAPAMAQNIRPHDFPRKEVGILLTVVCILVLPLLVLSELLKISK